MAQATPTLLYEMERYCNNYFNPQNDPDSSIRNYPDAFLILANEIAEFKRSTPKSNITSENVDGYSQSQDISYSSWQKAFAQELAIYKRLKVL